MRASARRCLVVVLGGALALSAATGGLAHAASTAGPALEQLDGVLLIAHGAGADGRPTAMQSMLRTAKGVVRLHVPAARHTQAMALSGAHVRVRGTRAARAFQAATIDPATGVSRTATATAGAPRPMRIAVVLMHLPGSTVQDETAAAAQQLFFDPNATAPSPSVASWMSENSGGQVAVSGRVYGWYNSSLPTSDCDIQHWLDAGAAAAKQDGYLASNYDHLVVSTPAHGCPFWGIAYVNWNGVYIAGPLAASVANHELGHNLSLWHAGKYTCEGGCLQDYGDQNDVMGQGQNRHYNAYHKSLIGWIPASEVKTVVSGTQTIALTASENPLVPGSTELIMVQGTGGTKFAVERRVASGNDDAGVAGIWVRKVARENTDDTILPFNAHALAPGQSFVDAASQVTVTTLTNAGATASVQVCVGPCGAPPTSTSTTTSTTSPTSTSTSTSTTTTSVPPPPPGGLGFVKTVATGSLSKAGNGALTLTVPPGGGAAAGDRVVIAAAVGTKAGVQTCNDSEGNAYTVDASTSTHSLFVCSAYLSRALVPGDTMTLTYPAFSGVTSAIASEVTGTVASAPVDGPFRGGSSTSTRNVSVNPPLTTTNPRDLVFAVVANKYALTAGSGFTGAGFYGGISPAYLVTTTPGTFSAVGTVATGAWSALVVAYKGS